MVGVNGVGKTTTIGKLAARYKKEGKKVKAGNEAICTARKAEMIINAKIQELKQNGNVTKQELKQKMK